MFVGTWVMEDSMKKLKFFGLALLVALLLSLPAAAQKGKNGERSDKGGTVRGKARAEQVQAENKKGVTGKGLDKTETKKSNKSTKTARSLKSMKTSTAKKTVKAAQPDNDKNKGKHKGETQGKHEAKGHR